MIKTYFFMDMGVMFGRSMRHIFRSVDTIMTVTISPIAIMLLFVFVLGGAIKIGTDNYVNYLLPGILLMTIANGVGYVSYRLLLDKQRGIFERFHSMPIARSSALWGHVLVSLVSNAISVTVIILIAFIMGFRSPAGVLPWLSVVGILVLFTFALTWIAAISGLTAKSADSAGAFAFVIHLLPFISSAFVPTETMPTVVRVFAENQPVTSIVNAIRALLNNQPVGSDIWVALAWCVGIMFVAYFFAMRAYKKRV
ncbi:MAG: ABC transporter permease [Lentimicrobiaceae bacterium]|jgi:ABC-2 type transport system permease protein